MYSKILLVALAMAVYAVFLAATGGIVYAQLPPAPPATLPPLPPPPVITQVDASPDLMPSAPNTGAGGDAAANLAVLGSSGLITIAGMIYLARKLLFS